MSTSEELRLLTEKLGRVVSILEENPGSNPFTQEETVALKTLTKWVDRVEALGWFGKWLLWILATAVVVLSQWTELGNKLRGQ